MSDAPHIHPLALKAKELHDQLKLKYDLYSSEVETAWRSFNRSQREKCIKAAEPENTKNLQPDYSPDALTVPDSDWFLILLEHRATNSLFDQYTLGPRGLPGDHDATVDFYKGQIHPQIPREYLYTRCMVFYQESEGFYGEIAYVSPEEAPMSFILDEIRGKNLVQMFTGEAILCRQTTLLQFLNAMVDVILKEYSKIQEAARRIRQIIAHGKFKEEWPSWYLSTVHEKPHILCQTVNDHLASHPLLQTWENTPSRAYVSMAIYEVLKDKEYSLALWKCITHLLELLTRPSENKVYWDKLIYELYSLCELEFGRALDNLKRHLSTGILCEWLHPGEDNNGRPCYLMRSDPGDLVDTDRGVRHLFCYFRPDFNLYTAGDFTEWLYDTSGIPLLKEEKTLQRERYALIELNAITDFAKDLFSIFPRPTSNQETKPMFHSLWENTKWNFSRTQKPLEIHGLSGDPEGLNWLGLDTMKDLKDLESENVYDASLSAEMAASALESLDSLFQMYTGNTMGELFEKLVTDFEKQCDQLEVTTRDLDLKREVVAAFTSACWVKPPKALTTTSRKSSPLVHDLKDDPESEEEFEDSESDVEYDTAEYTLEEYDPVEDFEEVTEKYREWNYEETDEAVFWGTLDVESYIKGVRNLPFAC
ncbi:asparaginase 3 [Fusarium beomiforme]|uniref:Asparaginase 3 n=1 Tax=Fusarium beomiforme TaxID=44412 RepID=A0A9P5ALR8_9HYPO|nr:asparaginase 3 [Fusarium beomiforme]